MSTRTRVFDGKRFRMHRELGTTWFGHGVLCIGIIVALIE